MVLCLSRTSFGHDRLASVATNLAAITIKEFHATAYRVRVSRKYFTSNLGVGYMSVMKIFRQSAPRERLCPAASI